MDIENITESQALDLFLRLSDRFGWAGTVFTRADADQSWSEYHEQPGELSDDQWEQVCNTWEWRKGVTEMMTERGWDMVHDAVGDLLR